MKKYFSGIGRDFPASIVVLLVALPLCLGIALGSGAPLFSGIIAGVVGGVVVGLLSGSSLSVSGPAAGLTVIVASSIGKLPVYEAFLVAVVIAGLLQLLFGFIRAGVIGDYIPNSVIKGMLAAIGFILILKQLPHLVGYDSNFEGDESFAQRDTNNTFSAITNMFQSLTPTATVIGLVSLMLLIAWESKALKRLRLFQLVPAPLIVVLTAVFLNQSFVGSGAVQPLGARHLVGLPVAADLPTFLSFFTLPDFSFLSNGAVWTSAITIAVVASLETLLGIEAVDKLDPLKRVTPANRELKAQGIGNLVSGLIGGIPITSVVVRSSANVAAGAQTKAASILHGVMLFCCVLFIPSILNKIPLSALAAILIFTGYKLAKISLFREFFRKGADQYIPFLVTIVAILLTDLLIGICVGIAVGLFFMIRSNFHSSVMVVNDRNQYLIRLRKDVSFLNKPIIKKKLEDVPPNAFVIIDVTRADFIDQDIIEEINNFGLHAHLKNITVELRKSEFKSMHLLLHHPKKKYYESLSETFVGE